jgi:nitrogenase-stabilizing/protective protein
MTDLKTELRDLETAEDFLDYFEISYDSSVVQRCRLHILQRAHDYLRSEDSMELEDNILRARFKSVLERSYQDFVESTPLGERVFKVLRDAKAPPPQAAQNNFVPLEAITGPVKRS